MVRKYFSIFKISFSNSLAYKYDFIFRGFFFILILFIFKQIWLSAPLKNTEFTVKQLIWYLVITESIMLSFPDIRSRIDTDIKTGSIAILLNKPFHYPFYNYMIYLGELIPRFIINIILGVLGAYFFCGKIVISSLSFLIFISLILSFTINFFILMSIAVLAFWFEETQPFFWIYHKILFTIGGLLVPIEFFPDILKKISMNLPFTVILYKPAKLFLKFNINSFYSLIQQQFLWCFVIISICEIMYFIGIRRIAINGG